MAEYCSICGKEREYDKEVGRYTGVICGCIFSRLNNLEERVTKLEKERKQDGKEKI